MLSSPSQRLTKMLRLTYFSMGLLFFSLGPHVQGLAQVKMSRTKYATGISGLLPANLHPMTDGDIALRLPSVRKPLASYTSEDRLVEYSINVSATRWRSQDLPMVKDFFKSSILNLYVKVNFHEEKISEINKRPYAIFEFDSKQKYNYVQYTLIDGKTLVFSFSCPKQQKMTWQPVIRKMMGSVKVKSGF